MAKRKRPPTPFVDRRSANQQRDDRASRRAAAQDRLHRAEARRLQTIRAEAHSDQLTTLNAINSPLLRLPPELRNAVFAYVYAGTQYIIDDLGWLLFWSDGEEPVWLSLVCRQTHAEASLLPYKLGDFSIMTFGGGSHCLWSLKSFLKNRSPEQIDATVTLKLTTESTGSSFLWHQTRTAAYWVAKLESLSAEAAKIRWPECENFRVSDIGPSDP